jgi:hypothetical protein
MKGFAPALIQGREINEVGLDLSSITFAVTVVEAND